MTRNLPLGRAVLCAGLAASICAQDYQPATFLQTNQSFYSGFHRRDLNGNGQFDLVLEVNSSGAEGLYVLLDPGMTGATATVSAAFLVSQISIFGGYAQLIGFADMNADGMEDIVIEFESLFNGSEIMYLPGDGQGGFGARVVMATYGNFTSSTLGDFDGNGQTDFAYVNASGVVVYLQTNGSFAPALTFPGFPGGIVSGDFDGDGDDELALNFAGNMTVQPGGTPFAPPLTFTVVPGLGLGYSQDLDGDGLEDLIMQKSSSPPWLVNVFFGDATTMLSAPTDVIPGGGPNGSDYIGPFDIDGDGTDEMLAVIRNSPGYFLIRHDGARGFSPQPYGTTMVGGMIDLDLDGDLDQLVPDPANGGYQRLENLAIFGTGCAGASGVPSLAIGSAIPGNAAFSATIEAAAPSSLTLLFFSPTTQPGPCGPQIDLGQIYFPGLLAVSDAAGQSSYSVPLPASLAAGPYAMQGAVLDPAGAYAAAGLQWSMTTGRLMRVY